MKAFWAWLISAVCTIGLITGTLFYVIPKYAQHTETDYTVFIDKAIAFVVAHWIWIVCILAVILVVAIVLTIVFSKKKRR